MTTQEKNEYQTYQRTKEAITDSIGDYLANLDTVGELASRILAHGDAVPLKEKERGRDPWGLCGEFLAGLATGFSKLLAPGDHRNAEVLCFKGGQALSLQVGELVKLVSSFGPMIYTGIVSEFAKGSRPGGKGWPVHVPSGSEDGIKVCPSCGSTVRAGEIDEDGKCPCCRGES